jgi:hypothetical protein
MGQDAPMQPVAVPRHRSLVIPWLRRPAQRLIMPNWLAITIGPLILSWRPLDVPELAHELAHVRQWRENGLLFIPRYFLASRRAANADGDRYRDNIYEVEARLAEEAARKLTRI